MNGLKEHLAEAEQTGEYRITGEYSYRNRYCASEGLVLAGDALGFLRSSILIRCFPGLEKWCHACR